MYYLPKLLKKISLYSFKDSKKDKTSAICGKSEILKSEIGRYSYIGYRNIVINAKIGSFCSIGNDTRIGQSTHPLNWVSTSPVFNKEKNIMKKNFSKNSFEDEKKTLIENDVWIGNNVQIKSGVKISNGAVIGMGAVVTKDIGPYEIWAGNPAKMIRKRFSESEIERLLNIKWWDWDDVTIQKNADYFNNLIFFLKIQGKCN